MKQVAVVALAGLLAFSVSACTPRDQTATAIGGGVGALAGGVAAGSLGGAAVGGAIGAGTGYLISRNTVRCWKTNVFGHRYLGWCPR